jgi:hypothetical protein
VAEAWFEKMLPADFVLSTKTRRRKLGAVCREWRVRSAPARPATTDGALEKMRVRSAWVVVRV